MPKRRIASKSPEMPAGANTPILATYPAGGAGKHARGRAERKKEAIRIEEDDAPARWGRIEHLMADFPEWKRGVQVLGLVVHNAIETHEPEEMRAFADDIVTRFFAFVRDEAALTGKNLTEEQAEDVAHAFLAAGITFAEALPLSPGGKPS